MNEANTIKQLSVSLDEFRQRLAPLAILGYQVGILAALVVVGLLAYGWFGQPSPGFLVDPKMVVGNIQETRYAWEPEIAGDSLNTQAFSNS